MEIPEVKQSRRRFRWQGGTPRLRDLAHLAQARRPERVNRESVGCDTCPGGTTPWSQRCLVTPVM